MNVDTLYKMLSFPTELIEILRKHPHNLTEEKFKFFSAGMRNPSLYAETVKQLRAALQEDINGYKMLNVLLQIACDTYEDYRAANIGDDVFIQTQKCFLRFATEHKASFGVYGFDRWNWIGRQLSLQLFRIGELEYELSTLNGEKAISLHIPSDTDLLSEKVTQSLQNAKIFIKNHFSMYDGATYFCSSWLLSPALREVLPEKSKILDFAKRFTVIAHDDEPEDYKIWVYGRLDISPEDFAENTTLQRNLKKYVLAGGHVGETTGILNF